MRVLHVPACPSPPNQAHARVLLAYKARHVASEAKFFALLGDHGLDVAAVPRRQLHPDFFVPRSRGEAEAAAAARGVTFRAADPLNQGAFTKMLRLLSQMLIAALCGRPTKYGDARVCGGSCC